VPTNDRLTDESDGGVAIATATRKTRRTQPATIRAIFTEALKRDPLDTRAIQRDLARQGIEVELGTIPRTLGRESVVAAGIVSPEDFEAVQGPLAVWHAGRIERIYEAEVGYGHGPIRHYPERKQVLLEAGQAILADDAIAPFRSGPETIAAITKTQRVRDAGGVFSIVRNAIPELRQAADRRNAEIEAAVARFAAAARNVEGHLDRCVAGLRTACKNTFRDGRSRRSPTRLSAARFLRDTRNWDDTANRDKLVVILDAWRFFIRRESRLKHYHRKPKDGTRARRAPRDKTKGSGRHYELTKEIARKLLGHTTAERARLAELEALHGRVCELERERDELRERLEEANARAETSEEERRAIEEERRAIEERLVEVEAELVETRESEAAAKCERDALRAQLAEKEPQRAAPAIDIDALADAVRKKIATGPGPSSTPLESIDKPLELVEGTFTHGGRRLSRKRDRALTSECDAGRLFVALLARKPVPFSGRKLHTATSELRHALGPDMVSGEGEGIFLAVEFTAGPVLQARISL
jgi:hypothetical protein